MQAADSARPADPLECKKRELFAELHICAIGSHGFGMHKRGQADQRLASTLCRMDEEPRLPRYKMIPSETHFAACLFSVVTIRETKSWISFGSFTEQQRRMKVMSNLDEVGQALARIAGDRASIERALAPGRSMADLVKAIQPPSHFAAIAEITNAMKPPAYLTAVSQMVTAMQREHRLFTEVSFRSPFLGDLTKQFAQLRALSESITGPHHAIQEMMRSQSAVFEGLSAQVATLSAIKFSIPQFSQTRFAWNVASIGLANRMSDIGLLAQREMLSARLFEAPSAYTPSVP